MRDQMFSAENFRHIFDVENRKGLDIAGRYFRSLDVHTRAVRKNSEKIKQVRKEIRVIKSGKMTKKCRIEHTKLKAKLKRLKSRRDKIKEKKSDAVDAEMKLLSKTVTHPSFKLSLTKKTGAKGKDLYSISESVETFFVVKLLQKNIFRFYKERQANRHELACRVRDTLETTFPFELVRTDISSFYESINRKRLYAKLDKDPFLSTSSKRFIKQVFDSYQKLTGSKSGIPRGVGISAYLAEIYLRQVDQAIQRLPGIVLYCRYVDDIVAIFARPPIYDSVASYKECIIDILEKSDLKHNKSKTEECDLGKGTTFKFDYLGYRFTVKPKSVEIALSDASFEKIKFRIDAAFNSYAYREKFDSRRAFREVVARVKFLTGNSQLKNSKSGATTGVYCNNRLVTNLNQFRHLDSILYNKIKKTRRPTLKKKLSQCSFEFGFDEKHYHNFSAKQFKQIVKVWKHAKA